MVLPSGKRAKSPDINLSVTSQISISSWEQVLCVLGGESIQYEKAKRAIENTSFVLFIAKYCEYNMHEVGRLEFNRTWSELNTKILNGK